MGKAIGSVILGIIIIFVVSAVIVLIAGDLDIEADPTALTVVLLMSLPLEVVFLAAAFAFSVRKYRVSRAKLGLRPPDRGGVLLVIGLFLGSWGIAAAYFEVLSLAGINPDTDFGEVYDNVGPVVAVAILALLFAPVMEETFFRGFIFGGLRRPWGLVGAALGSGLLFGMLHLGNPGGFYLIPPITLVGAVFAWGYAYSGSIYPSMGAHFLFNLVSLGVGLATS
ncbi:MAG: lysostaphin resistance A-like protein [Dehalococcoidia bacterium]